MNTAHRPFMQRRIVLGMGIALVAVTASIGVVHSLPDRVVIPAKDKNPKRNLVPAVFSHREHDAQLCYTCHPTLFPAAPTPFTHKDMAAGQYCGACHNGRRATDSKTMKCELCHVVE